MAIGKLCCGDLEIGKLYRVNGVCYSHRQFNDTIESCIEIKINEGTVLLPERDFPTIRTYPSDAQLYMLLRSKEYSQRGIKFWVQFYLDDGEDDDGEDDDIIAGGSSGEQNTTN